MILPLARTENLVIQQTEDGLRITEGTEQWELAAVTAEVWRHANGERTPGELAAIATERLGERVDEGMIWAVLDRLADARLLIERVAPPGAEHVSRRHLLRRVGAMAAGIAVISAALPEFSAFAATPAAQEKSEKAERVIAAKKIEAAQEANAKRAKQGADAAQERDAKQAKAQPKQQVPAGAAQERDAKQAKAQPRQQVPANAAQERDAKQAAAKVQPKQASEQNAKASQESAQKKSVAERKVGAQEAKAKRAPAQTKR